MSASTEVAERLISSFLTSDLGVRKLAAAMGPTVLTRVSSRTPWAWSHRETAEPFPEGGWEVRASCQYRFEVVPEPRALRFDQMIEQAASQLTDGLSKSWFAHLLAQPTAGGLERLPEVVGQTPALVMSPLTYADFWGHPRLGGRFNALVTTLLFSGMQAEYEGCPVGCYRQIEPGSVWVVPRGVQERSPIEMSVKVVENKCQTPHAKPVEVEEPLDFEHDELDVPDFEPVEIKGYVDFEFEARLTVKDASVMRLSV